MLSRSDRAQVWAVTSGKGGVGRSFLTANLGNILARDVSPVTLVDLDFEGANLHTFLGLSRERGGIDLFLRRRAHSLNDLVRETGIPGLLQIDGPVSPRAQPSSRERARINRAILRLSTPAVILDLASGGSDAVLDFFVAADRPVLVTLPEPAAVENAHRFIARVYSRMVGLAARRRGVAPSRYRKLLNDGRRPTELLNALETVESGLGASIEEELSKFTVYLVVNQVRHASDNDVGMALEKAVRTYFGISVRYVGPVQYDDEAWLSARRRRLRTREASSDGLGVQLERVICSLIGDNEVGLPSVVAKHA